MAEGNDKRLITSIDILKITNISRATLNNYIHMGLLPKPMVRKNDDPGIRARKVGFFPDTVLDRIKSIMDMKAQGRTMAHIIESLTGSLPLQNTEALDLKTDVDPKNLKGAVKKKSQQEELFPSMEKKNEERLIEHSKGLSLGNDIKLTLTNFPSPAYLVNSRYEIAWINEQALKEIFNLHITEFHQKETINIFRLFFEGRHIKDEKNRTALVDIQMRFLKVRCLRTFLSRLYGGISEKQVRILEYLYDQVEPASPEILQQTYVDQPGDEGSTRTYLLYNILCDEGVLFVFIPSDSLNLKITQQMSNRLRLFKNIFKQRPQILISYCVLVAELQAADKIGAELPAVTYFSLCNDLWKAMDGAFRKYYGIYGRYKGNGTAYFFLANKSSNYLTDVLSCALDIREALRKLNRHLTSYQGGFKDIHINMGIDEGQDYFGFLQDRPESEFTVLGDAVDHAALLADFARFGSVWTTKNLINKLTAEELGKMRFGLRIIAGDMASFSENRFGRIMDLCGPDNPQYGKYQEIAHLAVTEILEASPR